MEWLLEMSSDFSVVLLTYLRCLYFYIKWYYGGESHSVGFVIMINGEIIFASCKRKIKSKDDSSRFHVVAKKRLVFIIICGKVKTEDIYFRFHAL